MELEVGQIQWHSSEEDGGPDVGVLLQLPGGWQLWAGELLDSESVMGSGFILYSDTEKHLIGDCDYEVARALVEAIAPFFRPTAAATSA